MIKNRTLTTLFISLSLLTLANCSKNTTEPSTLSGDAVKNSPFGTDTIPTTPLSTNANSPAGKIGTDTNTVPSLGAPGSQNPFAGLSSPTQTGGAKPLSFPSNYGWGNLIPKITSLVPFIDPTNIRFFPKPELLKQYYCSIQLILGYQAASKASYVEALYLDVLGRLPDPDGFVEWIRRLSNEQSVDSRKVIATGIMKSDESYRRIVNGLYRSVLERAQQNNEGQYWVNRLKAGTSIEQVMAEFHASEENFNRFGRNPYAWVEHSLYRKILGRYGVQPSGASDIASWEINFWVGFASTDDWSTRTQTALAIIKSPESQQKFVETLYAKYLGRVGDPGGIQAWTELLTNGSLDRIAVEIEFLASAEYYTNSAQRRFLVWNSPQFCEQ